MEKTSSELKEALLKGVPEETKLLWTYVIDKLDCVPTCEKATIKKDIFYIKLIGGSAIGFLLSLSIALCIKLF